ncbi:hypothetical protein H1C71_011784, partial [Ictidomys tridecemlineatus]
WREHQGTLTIDCRGGLGQMGLRKGPRASVSHSEMGSTPASPCLARAGIPHLLLGPGLRGPWRTDRGGWEGRCSCWYCWQVAVARVCNLNNSGTEAGGSHVLGQPRK